MLDLRSVIPCALLLLIACGGEAPTGQGAHRPVIPAHLIVEGGSQLVFVGDRFIPPVAIVFDSSGGGVPGVTVLFTASGSGTVDPESTTTDHTGRAATNWFAGAGYNTLTVHVGGLEPVTITSRGLDSAKAARFELSSIEPTNFGFRSSLFLVDSWFYTTVNCPSPGCFGWGSYLHRDSTVQLSYVNDFWSTQYSDHQESAVLRADTLFLARYDDLPLPETWRFVCADGARLRCKSF
jgi:hypothetical protein